MNIKRVIQISDLHLSSKRAYAYLNWQAVLNYIHQARPDLVINTGDTVLDAPDDEEDHDFGKAQMDLLPVPWKTLPGNHDIGDTRPDPWQGEYITERHLARYLQRYSEDRWTVDLGNWRLIGINSQLLGSALPAEADMWNYLHTQLQESDTRPIAIFMHKPPCVHSFEENGESNDSIPVDARRRFARLISKYRVRLIASGHLHEYRTFQARRSLVIVAPCTGFVSTEDQPSALGIRRNGCVEYTFGERSVAVRMIEPAGVSLIDYGEIDPAVPRYSRFLPLKPIGALTNG